MLIRAPLTGLLKWCFQFLIPNLFSKVWYIQTLWGEFFANHNPENFSHLHLDLLKFYGILDPPKQIELYVQVGRHFTYLCRKCLKVQIFWQYLKNWYSSQNIWKRNVIQKSEVGIFAIYQLTTLHILSELILYSSIFSLPWCRRVSPSFTRTLSLAGRTLAR